MKKDLKGKERAVPPGIEIPSIPARKLVKRLDREHYGSPSSLFVFAEIFSHLM